MEYYGRFCQKRRATSCKEQLQKNRGSRSRVYQLFDPTTISLYEVFCDANSEKGFVWTLIESFSRRNKKEFANKPFYKGYPTTQDAFTWSKFRWSLPRMIVTANRSTHVRATCNFNWRTSIQRLLQGQVKRYRCYAPEFWWTQKIRIY